MIGFYSTHRGWGGSTLILQDVVALLNEGGIDARLIDDVGELGPRDALAFHGGIRRDLDLQQRPNVRRCVFVSHERTYRFRAARFRCPMFGCGETVADARSRIAVCRTCLKRCAVFRRLDCYDRVVFSSREHERKARELQAVWGDSVVIPNPIACDFEWQPPPGRVAGVIGSIERRKQTHVSIERARAAGFERVLLFGPVNDQAYFEAEVMPLGAEHMGTSTDRAAMYRSVGAVFHSSVMEQACMVLGECKVLGVPFHGSPETLDWDPVPRSEVFERWRDLLAS